MKSVSQAKENLVKALTLHEGGSIDAKELLVEGIYLLAQAIAIDIVSKVVLPKNIPVCPTCLTRLVDGRCARCDG